MNTETFFRCFAVELVNDDRHREPRPLPRKAVPVRWRLGLPINAISTLSSAVRKSRELSQCTLVRRLLYHPPLRNLHSHVHDLTFDFEHREDHSSMGSFTHTRNRSSRLTVPLLSPYGKGAFARCSAQQAQLSGPACTARTSRPKDEDSMAGPLSREKEMKIKGSPVKLVLGHGQRQSALIRKLSSPHRKTGVSFLSHSSPLSDA